jgi:hypothetical protein
MSNISHKFNIQVKISMLNSIDVGHCSNNFVGYVLHHLVCCHFKLFLGCHYDGASLCSLLDCTYPHKFTRVFVFQVIKIFVPQS